MKEVKMVPTLADCVAIGLAAIVAILTTVALEMWVFH